MEPPTTALVQARPKAISSAYVGRYADILRGWEAQATKFRRYIAEECRAARLPSAVGQALLELAGSEFWATIDQNAQQAVGEATFSRIGSLPAGVIKSGHRFAKEAQPTASPEIKAAQYVATSPVYVKSGQISFAVPLQATVAGDSANVLKFIGANAPGVSLDAVFDSGATLQSLNAAGGSNGVDDPWSRVIAAASYCGQFGPVNSALIAGAFEIPRVRRVALSLDTSSGVTRLFIADASWAYSDRLGELVKQNLRDRWLGWGARCDLFPIENKRINVQAAVTLKGPQFLDDLADVSEKIRTALVDYFDERPDFYSWRLRALRGLISQCDSRILTCSSVSVLDDSGTPLTEPAAKLSGTATRATHYLLSSKAIDVVYSIPS